MIQQWFFQDIVSKPKTYSLTQLYRKAICITKLCNRIKM
jgi:hypothetical protein